MELWYTCLFIGKLYGYCRINAQKHDGWEVLAGAVIGISSAYIFTNTYQKEPMSSVLQ
ncbi:hypothetical protein ACNR9Q_03095 [Maribacter sp. X9]|uniref:hypothetical protein n=1 Tax=Maribacter sp. X9 TaxID=3402159 RepID=UPI003AF368D2